jgi:hypothetical protein
MIQLQCSIWHQALGRWRSRSTTEAARYPLSRTNYLIWSYCTNWPLTHNNYPIDLRPEPPAISLSRERQDQTFTFDIAIDRCTLRTPYPAGFANFTHRANGWLPSSPNLPFLKNSSEPPALPLPTTNFVQLVPPIKLFTVIWSAPVTSRQGRNYPAIVRSS